MRRVAFCIGLVAGALGAAGPALAADAALMSPIGFSENMRYFAFEEFGVGDGSGLAYSSIYMVDIAQDRWVVGTPVRVVAESEDETLAAVRAEARAGADPRLADLRIDVPARLIAGFGDGSVDGDGRSLSFGLPAFDGPGIREPRYDLGLDAYPTDAGSPCEDWFGEQPLGFLLRLASTGIAEEVHRDGVLPRSRGCPEDYRLSAVYVPFGAMDLTSAIVMVSTYAHGFEGLDRRFIALSLKPPATD